MKALATLALLLAATVPATAQEAGPTPAPAPAVHVSFADLNLGNAAGRAQLDRRIDRAINTLCPEAITRQLAEWQAVHACRTAAYRSAAAQRSQALASNSSIITIASGH